jgi:hypothetical protein
MDEVAGSRRVHVLDGLPAARPDVVAHGAELEFRVLVLVPGADPREEPDPEGAAETRRCRAHGAPRVRR